MRRAGILAILAAAVAFTGGPLDAGPAVAVAPSPGLPATLRVLVAADEMPEMFSFEEKGRPGFEREMLEGFCRIHGLRMEVVPVRDFDQIIPMLLRGEGDVVTGIVDTPARRRKVAFSTEVFPVRHLAVTRRPGPAVPRVEDLRALRVGVIPGTSWEQAAADAGVPKAKRIAFRDADALLAGLRAGEADAAVMALLDYALASKRDPELAAGTFVGSAVSAALAVRPEDGRLLEALNGYLQGMRQARHALMFKYLSEEALSLIALARRE
jgi:ABC-type amino acid transport substrate-binding protein